MSIGVMFHLFCCRNLVQTGPGFISNKTTDNLCINLNSIPNDPNLQPEKWLVHKLKDFLEICKEIERKTSYKVLTLRIKSNNDVSKSHSYRLTSSVVNGDE